MASEKDIATPEVAEALQLWVDLMKDGSLSKGALNWTQADAENQFAAGKAAMMINGPWQFPALDAVKGLNYGVVPIPVNKAGQSGAGPAGRRGVDRAEHGQRGQREERREDRCLPQQ